jgi:two-component system KDP operon response regulator KdpE
VASVLLIDDDPQIVRSIVPALEVNGLAVTVRGTAQQAIEQADLGGWDALVVDLGLPDMDGKAVIRHVRLSSAAPIVVISARHSEAEVADARSAGADDFLHKPFRTPELVERLRDLLMARGCVPE